MVHHGTVEVDVVIDICYLGHWLLTRLRGNHILIEGLVCSWLALLILCHFHITGIARHSKDEVFALLQHEAPALGISLIVVVIVFLHFLLVNYVLSI